MSASAELLETLARETSPRRRPSAVIVDWESTEKYQRQVGSESLIGTTTNLHVDPPDGVETARHLGFDRVICRINAFGEDTPREVESVIAQGGTDVLLPMWRSTDEIHAVRDLISGRARCGVMVETAEAVAAARQLQVIQPDFVFIGLMDLAIDRKTLSIFTPMVDGTLDRLTEDLGDLPFGFGGLTLPHLGTPIPSRLLVGEMLRLGSHFGILRRSFFRDVPVQQSATGIEEIGDAMTRWASRSIEEISRDRDDLQLTIRSQK